jgi:two-component system phosphate regulon sensor histidine kinase PhoR
MFRSIKWRIATAFTVLILVCISGLNAYLLHFVKEDYLHNLSIQLINQARLIGNTSTSYLTDGQIENIDVLAKRLGEQIDARVTIINRDGVVLGDSEKNPATMENHADRPEVIKALTQGIGSSTRFSTTLGYDMMYVAVPIMTDGKILGVARVSLSLAELDKSMANINRTIIWGDLATVIIAILLVLQISKIITEPVKKLTWVLKKMTEGELDQEIQATSKDEIGKLAKAFNLMAAKIKEMVTLITTERDRMSVILFHIGDAIFVVDGDSKVTMINQAAERILQLSKDKVLGHTFIEVMRDYKINEILQHCLKSREQQTQLVETRHKKQFLGVIVTPLQGETGCLVLLQNLTELRRLETVRRDFISNISHELRTPIASLKALAETLQDGAIEDSSVAKDFLGKINTEVDRLAQMVQELGDLFRIESGGASLQKKLVDISKTIKHAVERLGAQSDRAGLNLETNIPCDLSQVLADEMRVEQVLVNLIHNAIKFTLPGGRIIVSAKIEGSNILVSVNDAGVGIPADDLPRIFERFYKVDKARGGGGTGMGLAIAKHIVEAHGGRIWAMSVEGKGSTFNFTLPLASKS